MDLATQLELLLDVAEYGTFAKAADRNHIDRSALSKQIKKLEDNLGLRLLNRSTRSLSLTQAGVEMVAQAKKVRDVLSETRSKASRFQSEPKGHLKISCSAFFGRTYLGQAVQTFMKQYPGVTVELRLDDERVDVIHEGYDVVFRIGPIRESNMIVRRLATNHMALVASREFILQHKMPESPEALSQLPAIIYANHHFKTDKLRIAPTAQSREIKTYPIQGSYFVNETDLILDAVKSGLGFALIGEFFLTSSLESQGLVRLLPDHYLPPLGDIYAMYTHRNQQPLAKLFIDSVQQSIGSPPVWQQFSSSLPLALVDSAG